MNEVVDKSDQGLSNKFFRQKKNTLLVLLGALINGISWIYIIMNISPQEAPAFLHYNIYFGVDLIGDWYWIYLLPASGLLGYLVNTFFSYIIYSREKIISYIIIGITLFLEVIVVIASILIIRQNSY